MGKIAGILLAFGGFFMGRDFAGKHFGGSDVSAPSAGVGATPTKTDTEKTQVVEKNQTQEERVRQQAETQRIVDLYWKMEREKKSTSAENAPVNPAEPLVPNVTKPAGQNQGTSLKI
jgi:hypothetical protein